MNFLKGNSIVVLILCWVLGVVVGIVFGLLGSNTAASMPSPYHTNKGNQQTTATTFKNLKISQPFPHVSGKALCNTLRPRVDPEVLGNTILQKQLATRRGLGCRESVWYEMGREGLGHRLGNYLAGLAVSLTWGIPPIIGVDDADRCGTHGCYNGLEDSLGLARGLQKSSSLTLSEHVRVKNWEHGSSLKAALLKQGETCNALWTLGQDVWLRDLTISRWSLFSQLLKREQSKAHPLRSLPFVNTTNSAIIAIHLRYGGSDFHKQTDENWLKHLLTEELVPIMSKFNIPATFHVFTGSQRFSWLMNLKNVVIHSSEIDAITTFRSLAHSDVLICGHSSMCFHAALVQAFRPLALSLVPHNTEPFPYDMCPDDLQCVDNSGSLTNEQRIRVKDVLFRSILSRQLNCPSFWQT